MNTPDLPISIILADDHEIFRDGFTSLINKQPGFSLVAEAANGEQLVQLAEKFLPDIILTDIKMPVMDGIEATRAISKNSPQVGIIALSMFNEDDLLIDMIKAGAKGYLLKNAGKQEIINAINSVNNNNAYYCDDTSNKLAKLLSKKRLDDNYCFKEYNLTEKEKEIIIYICQGLSSKEISEKLFLSARTIEGHRENIMQKTHVRKTAGIVRFAMEHKYLFPGIESK